MKQFKTCKGQNKAYGFSSCGNQVPAKSRTYGLCRECYKQWLLTTPEGQQKMQSAILKASKPRRELEKAQKERKERTGITTLIKSVVNTFHEYVRVRDEGKPCPACGTPWKSDFQASHFYKAELYSSLRFHEDNVHAGCMECNLRKEGNLNGYELNLPERIGMEKFEDLKHLARMDKRNGEFKWDREKLKETRAKYRIKLKQLKTQLS